MKKVFSSHISYTEEVTRVIETFGTAGELFVKGKRNTIKIFHAGGLMLNVKSFKVPNFINKLVYAYIRKSKARRSFEFAHILLDKGIGTPQPVAYFENTGAFGLKDSYYVSEHLLPDLTFRELVSYPDYPDHENILRQFTRFSFRLHEAGIEFKDHSPGNTLIKKTGEGNYDFFLVDLNRIAFHQDLGFDLRMENLKRLTPKEEMVRVMSNEYAKLYDKPEEEIFNALWGKTEAFQKKFRNKRALKKKLGLAKK